MDRWKSTARKKLRHGESQKGEDKRGRRSEMEKVRRKKMQVREKVGKSWNSLCVFTMICSSGGLKSRLAKATGAEPAGQMKNENCTPFWREAHLEVNSVKNCHVWTTFGSCDVEQVHAIGARSTFWSQNVESTTCSDLFITIRWRFDVEKVHPIVARSTFGSQMCQTFRVLSHFWCVRCRFVDKYIWI